MDHAVIGDGCIITNGTLTRSLVGIRSVVQSGAVLESVVMLGADYYETLDDLEENNRLGRPALGIGQNSRIKHAILDKNVRIGKNVRLDPTGLPDTEDVDQDILIRDGVLIVCKNAIVPDGFEL